MSEPLTDEQLAEIEAHEHFGSTPDVFDLLDEVRRLRAAEAGPTCPVLRVDPAVGTSARCGRPAAICAHHLLAAQAVVLAVESRAASYAAALAHIESLGFHVEGCIPWPRPEGAVGPDCAPDCPTAPAKRAREDR